MPPDVRDRIAAGEVIARPVSVIKELIENSLDAGAHRIEIDSVDGGKQKCLVNDDGLGMNRDDAVLSIERYSTSKLATIDDIEKIATHGFRGEALASIAQVSHFELETSDGMQGTRVEVMGGDIKGVFDSERPRGTRVRVSNLFFNLPARLKFLKSAQWERTLIAEVVKAYAFINPGVHFSLADKDRSLLDVPGTESMGQRLTQLLPRRIVDMLLAIDIRVGPVHVFGYSSRPDFAEPHHVQYLFVNSRPVRYPRIYRTLIDAYGNPQNPPAFVLNIAVQPSFVDVNIHPTKNEVKFKDERYIADILAQVITKQVVSSTIATDYGKAETTAPGVKRPAFVQESMIPYVEDDKKLAPHHEANEFWQLHDTYILSQTKSGLIIIDQHVAHERIIYEAIMTGEGGAQRLLFPITFELTPEEYRAYKKTKSQLKELGVEFKEFSSRTIVLDSMPAVAHIDRETIMGLFKDMEGLGNLIGEKSEVAKVVACHSAIKAGQKLGVSEMQSLVDRLFACENPYVCPHGRPIVVRLTLDELATRFGRV